VAVQVLAAIIEDHTPDSQDVEELRRFAPLLADLPIDELARNVVNAELKRRGDNAKRKGIVNSS